MTAFSPAPDPRRERGQRSSTRRPPTRPGRASARTRSWASPTASTRRPGSASRCATRSSGSPNADLDAMDDQPAARRFWERIDKVPADELWEAHQRQKLELAIFARGRLRNQFARHGEAPATLEELEQRPRPDDPDDRLRPPVRDLQAGGAAVHRPRPAGPAAVGRGAAGPGRLRRQGPPRRPARPGRHPGHLRPLAQPQAPRPRVHPRGLRHPHRPVPRPGRRRLAQQPAPAARGVRARRA